MPGTVAITRSTVPLGHLVRDPFLEVITLTCVGDATDGSVPNTVIPKVRGTLVRLVSKPSTPAPTTLYDIVVNDQDGLDVLAAAGANRSATLSEEAAISMTGGIPRIVGEDLTYVVSNQAVVSARWVTRLFVRKD